MDYIEELKQIEGAYYFGTEYQDVDLLEYVAKVANEFNPEVIPDVYTKRYPLFHGVDEEFTVFDYAIPVLEMSKAPNKFAIRYFQDEIDTSMKETYMGADELQDTLQAFGIDANKYWYLVLFIKDYVEDKCTNSEVMNYSPKEELQDILDELKKMDWKKDGSYKYNATLTLKVGNKHCLTVTNALSFLGLEQALEKYISNIEDGSCMATCIGINDTVTLDPIYKIYIYTNMLKWFLQPFKANRRYKASFDKLLLISRTIYIVGLSTNKERYYEEYKGEGKEVIKRNSLKNDLRRYEGVKIRTTGNIYM